MPYPTTRPLKIKINGTDRTSLIPIESVDVEDALGKNKLQLTSASFDLEDGGALGLAELQEVIISDPTEATRYFAGFIYSLEDSSRGPKLDFRIECVDYGWYLQHPEALVDGTHQAKSDQWIIQNAVASTIPDVDCTTYVEQVEASIVSITFDQEPAWQVLEKLAAIAGAYFYVDYGPGPGGKKAYLHYFDAGTNAAPFSLSDSPNLSTSYPYKDLRRIEKAPQANRVIVIGAGSVTATRTRGLEGDYGWWLTTVLKDKDITTVAQAEARGDQLLDDLATNPAFSCVVLEPGLRSGQQVTLVNAARSVNASYEIKRVRTAFESGGYAQHTVELGIYIPELPELVAQPHQDASGYTPLEHTHEGGADGPNIPIDHITPEPYHPGNSHTHSFADTAEGTTGAGSSHSHSFSASVTGASAAEAAHTHSFADTAEGTTGAGSSHSHTFSASVTGTSGAGSSHSHTFSASVTGASGAEAAHTHSLSSASVTGTSGAESSHTHSFSASVTGTSAAGSSHTHSFSASVTGTSAAGSSHSHSIGGITGSGSAHLHSVSVSGTTGAGAQHLHSVSVSGTTGTPSATRNVYLPRDGGGGTEVSTTIVDGHSHKVGFDITLVGDYNHTHTVTSSGNTGYESSHTHSFDDTANTEYESGHVHNQGGTTGAEAGHTHGPGVIGGFAVSGTTGAEASHTHGVGTYAVSGTSGAGSSHTHGAGSYVAAGTTGAGSSHTHDAGTYAVSGTTGAEASHTHGPGVTGGFAVSGTTGTEASHTHGAGTIAVSGTTGMGSSHTHDAGTYAVSGTTGAEASHTHGAGTIAVSGTTGAS